MVFKVITSKDIKYIDRKIDFIDGIDFVKKQVVIKRDLYEVDISFAPQIIIDKKMMSDTWDKYVKDLSDTAGKPGLTEEWDKLKEQEKQQPTFKSMATKLTDCILRGLVE